MTRRWWVSWWTGYETDGRPDFPLWCTGARLQPAARSLCAVIDADTELDVWRFVEERYPDAEERFTEPKPAGWMPDAGRFPREEH